MAFRILPDETVEEAVQRIAHEQVEKSIDEIDDGDLDEHETVHQVRKRCKKIRGVIRLVRPAFDGYSAENAWYRDAARTLSDLRDATTLIECFDALMERHEGEIDAATFAPIRKALLERRDDVADSMDLGDRLDEFRDRMQASHDRIDSWSLEKEGVAAVRGGLQKTYGRARGAMDDAYERPKVERFHEWRKRVKYNRHHARLLREIWEPVMRPLRDEVKRLSDLLGDDHDLGVFRAVLIEEPDRFGPQEDLQALLGLMEQRRKELQAWAHPLGRRLYAEKPKRFAGRIGRVWRAWRAELQVAGALHERSGAVYS